MTASPDTLPDHPPPELLFKRRVHPIASLRELFRSRELIRSLAEREFRSRYKQAFLGATWAVLTPVILMIVFTVFFRRAVKIEPPPGVPYPIFVYVALLPWSFFSTSVASGGQSLTSNSALLNKVYCPREVFPLASVAVAGIDLLISSVVLGLLFVGFGFTPKATSVWVPLLFLVQLALTAGVTFIVASVLVYFRDLRQAIPMILQIGLFATPVAYGIDRVVPREWWTIYSTLNPIAPVIDGYRRCVLQGLPPRWNLLLPGSVTAVVVLIGGYLLLKRLETRFADVA